MTIRTGQYLRVGAPAITEKSRGFSITVLLDRFDDVFTLFLRSLTMIYGMNQPTTRQECEANPRRHIHKWPAITQVLSIPFVFA